MTAADTLSRPRAGRTRRVLGELLLIAGMVVVLFIAYLTFGVPGQTAHEQQALEHQLDQMWRDGVPAAGINGNADAPPGTQQAAQDATVGTHEPAAGNGFPLARLHIPKLGLHWVVVDGVSTADLRRGPGHYPRTQEPGELGNFAVAGHRIRGTFWDLDQLNAGDAVVVETATNWFVYRIDSSAIVAPTDTGVIAANPDHPGQPPDRSLLTLTTCNPKWGNWQRLIVQAQLQRAQPKTDGTPAELKR